jgi:hypothetical protein
MPLMEYPNLCDHGARPADRPAEASRENGTHWGAGAFFASYE